MASKTIRYQPHINAVVILEKFVVRDFTPNEQRGQTSKTADNTALTVYTESYQVKVEGSEAEVQRWCRSIEEALGSLQDTTLVPDFLDPLLVKGTRFYIEAIVRQINITFKAEAYDACAVLIRRLTETLIIELFEAKSIESKIKNKTGDFVMLAELVLVTIAESDAPSGAWNLGRNTKKGLPEIKKTGDQSAHTRRYLAKRTDINQVQPHLRVVTEELILLAGLK